MQFVGSLYIPTPGPWTNEVPRSVHPSPHLPSHHSPSQMCCSFKKKKGEREGGSDAVRNICIVESDVVQLLLSPGRLWAAVCWGLLLSALKHVLKKGGQKRERRGWHAASTTYPALSSQPPCFPLGPDMELISSFCSGYFRSLAAHGRMWDLFLSLRLGWLFYLSKNLEGREIPPSPSCPPPPPFSSPPQRSEVFQPADLPAVALP